MELPELVRGLASVEGVRRVRVMYAYPNRFPWELTALLREHPNVVPYLDIPVQHASTPVLRAMRRAGSGEQVRRTLDRLLEEVPGITLRTTLLVGFPGETDADARELVSFVEEYGLGRMGVFTFSPEQGTGAFELAPRVPADVARERAEAVLAARDRALRASQAVWIGREVEVLIDELHPAGRAGAADNGRKRAHGPARDMAAVGRAAMDAPEVDLVARVALGGRRVSVGDFVTARVDALDGESNLVCSLAAPPPGGSARERA
jgi:tRNA A37 methylthiotransferase MiaB